MEPGVRRPVDGPDAVPAGEELERLVPAGERLAEHLRGRSRREPVHRLLADAGEAAQLAEAPVVQREQSVRTGPHSETPVRRRLGGDGLGRVPTVGGLVLLPPAVGEEGVEVREAFVRRAAEQLPARAGQVSCHGMSSEGIRDGRVEKPNRLHHRPLGWAVRDADGREVGVCI